MAKRLPGLASLRTFEAAARHLSFTKAADELHVTPAAVSAQVRALEEQLGVRLFWRTSRAVRLTGAGETLLGAVSEALAVIARAVERIAGTDRGGRYREHRPLLRREVARPPARPVPPAPPRVDVRLDVTDQLADFARDGADVAIRFGAGVYPGMRADRLFEEELFPVCSPGLLKGAEPLRQPGDLRRHTLIHLDWQAQGETWPDWRMWLLAAGVEEVDPTRASTSGRRRS